MDSNLSGISQPGIKGLSTEPYAPAQTKSYAQAGAGAAANPELDAWFKKAEAYYNAVMAGDPNTPKPSEEEWNGFMAQLQWAQTQLYGAQGAPGTMGMGGPGMGQAQGPQSNQFGGTTGTMDNWVYTNEKAKIGFTGDGTHDIWSNDITINVAPTSADVIVENTTDTRFAPNESVVKITVTDPATGTQSVYFVHDYDPTKDKIKINTPDSATQVNNMTGDTTSITTGKFTPGGAGAAGSKPDASIEGDVQENGDILYQPEWAGGSTVDFWANPGESQTHVVYSNANITVGSSDRVNVTKAPDGTLIVTVKHTTGEFAGTTDTYKIQEGFKLENINVTPGYITFDDVEPADGAIPAAFKDRVTTINGGASTEGAAGAPNADAIVSALLDTTPPRTEGQLLTALQNIYPGQYPDIAAFKQAITNKTWPPSSPDPKLLDFLRIFDPDLAADSAELNSIRTTGTESQKKILAEKIQAQLATLLQGLYPDSIMSKGSINSDNYGGTISMTPNGNINWSLTNDGKLTIPGWVAPPLVLPDFAELRDRNIEFRF